MTEECGCGNDGPVCHYGPTVNEGGEKMLCDFCGDKEATCARETYACAECCAGNHGDEDDECTPVDEEGIAKEASDD